MKIIPLSFLVLISILFLLWIAYGYFSVRAVEQLKYSVLAEKKGYEIRQLDTHILAQTRVDGSFGSVANNGFRTVAEYIFGDNTSQTQISMTTPVISNTSEKIAMTTPVISSEESSEQMFSFVLPADYTIDTLPTPNNDNVILTEVASKKIAVLRFRGFYNDAKIAQKKQELITFLERDNISYGDISFAAYNPPFTPPFMRRLEIWADIMD